MKIDYQKLKQAKWYRQASDSVQYFIFGPGISVQKLMNGGLNFIVSGKRDHWRAFINEDYYLKEARAELAKFAKDNNYLHKLFTNWLKQAKPLEKKISSVIRLNLERLTNNELIKQNKKLGELARDIWLVPIFIDIFDPNADFLINERVRKAGLRLTADEISVLVQPYELLATQKYQLALYKLLRKKYSRKDLEAIRKNYYYITCSYSDGSGLSLNQIKEDLTNAYKKADLNLEINKLQNYSKDLDKRQQLIHKKYSISKSIVDFFGFFSELGVWRDHRKTLLQKTAFALNLLGQEIAKRSNLSWKQVNICAPYEIDSIPVKKSLLQKYKKLSDENYMQIWDPKTKRIINFDKKTSLKLSRTLEPESNLMELRGQTANLGKASGRVRVVSGEKDFNKFKLNEILVTAMTRPEFVPLMRKASAIITDEGGVTSHAAIVSRELNKPCIIGTRVATKVLKDGDMVEVNANHGWVRKL